MSSPCNSRSTLKAIVVSLCVLALFAAVLVRSRRHLDGLAIITPWSCIAVGSFGGGVTVGMFNLDLGSRRAFAAETFSQPVDSNDKISAFDDVVESLEHKATRFGFLIGSGRFTSISGQPWYAMLTLPNWLIALLLCVIVVRRVRAAAELRSRRANGLCVACEYDLRSSTGRCPECGLNVEDAVEGEAFTPSNVGSSTMS